jgi:hypothetical protein
VEIGEGEKGGCGGKRGWNKHTVMGEQWSGKRKAQKVKMIGEEALWSAKRASAQPIQCHNRDSWTQFSQAALSKGRIAAVVLALLSAGSGIIEYEDAAVSERDFGGLPRGALVILTGIIPYRLPFLVEPVQVRFVVGDPFLDGLPGWLDGLHGFDIEGRRWWSREMDDAFPESVKAEEELDFLVAEESADRFHSALAARALERVATPNLQDKVAPEGSHVASPMFGRCGDEDELDGLGLIGRGLCFYRAAEGCGAARGEAAGFIGIDAVVADGLLSLGRKMVDSGGDEVGRLKNLEIAFDIVVTLGAVDDGLAGGIPIDFLEGERVAQEVLGEAFTACGVVGGDDFIPSIVDVEAGVFP